MRVALRILAPLLGLLVAAVGVLIALESAVAWLAPASSPLVVPWPAWRATLDGLTWSSGTVRTAAILAGIVGLVVALVGLTARRHDVPLTDPLPEVTVTTSPRSLARAVGQQVRAHENVVSASVVASPRRITVRAASTDASKEVRAAVGERVDHALERLPLAERPRVTVTVSTAPTRAVR